MVGPVANASPGERSPWIYRLICAVFSEPGDDNLK